MTYYVQRTNKLTDFYGKDHYGKYTFNKVSKLHHIHYFDTYDEASSQMLTTYYNCELYHFQILPRHTITPNKLG